MTEQIDLFAAEADRLLELKLKRMFQTWKSLPPETLVSAGDPQRDKVLSMLNEGYGFLWDRALHWCEGIPPTRYIWLNAVQPAEYWVMNDFWNPAGKHVETCPYCGADLKAGGGDVLLVKANGDWWAVGGFLEGNDHDV